MVGGESYKCFVFCVANYASFLFCCHSFEQIHDHGTSHISIVDSQRNAVSMTTTINSYFGAKFMSGSTGIILNNEMDDFSIPANATADEPPPAPANFIEPGKRPLSSMTPTIILNVCILHFVEIVLHEVHFICVRV